MKMKNKKRKRVWRRQRTWNLYIRKNKNFTQAHALLWVYSVCVSISKEFFFSITLVRVVRNEMKKKWNENLEHIFLVWLFNYTWEILKVSICFLYLRCVCCMRELKNFFLLRRDETYFMRLVNLFSQLLLISWLTREFFYVFFIPTKLIFPLWCGAMG
jgi:hypothetical protein